MRATTRERIVFPADYKVQSPYFYLQSVGSTSDDGSTYGAHVRWILTGNLGETHLPKGYYAQSRVNFNRKRDYVRLYRSQYVERITANVHLTSAPDVIHGALGLWIYKSTGTGTVVYVYFSDLARYAAVRASVDPATDTEEFVARYSPGRLQVELPDELFFAVQVGVVRDADTVMRVEALSVESNVPLSPLFVSCRKRFTNANWCSPVAESRPRPRVFRSTPGGWTEGRVGSEASLAAAPPPRVGANLLANGGFEQRSGLTPFAFETDYRVQGGFGAGIVNVTRDAHDVNSGWVGLPHSGNAFLTVDGDPTPGKAVVRFRAEVEPQTTYCFSGWLATLYAGDVSIPLEFRFAAGDDVAVERQRTPATVRVWERFSFFWESQSARTVVVSIASLSAKSVGNDFALDDLSFSVSAVVRDCEARIESENMRGVRFDVTGGYPHKLAIETYHDYIAGTIWELLDPELALTTDDSVAWRRLEPAGDWVDGQWQKFNDQAPVRADNYMHRWARADGGIKEGVERYIALSETDPRAIAVLTGEHPEDGSIEVSMLDALQLGALDFHVARMLGFGYLDRFVEHDELKFVYLGVYDTDGPLDDLNVVRAVRHYAMSVPTAPRDHRLPTAPVLEPVTYGLSHDNGEAQPPTLTDAGGYTPDGQARYVNLSVRPEPASPPLGEFFEPADEFCSLDHTAAVAYGVEYRKQSEATWRRPEIAHDPVYTDAHGNAETVALPSVIGSTLPVLRHEEREDGVHQYAGYSINWYSRASAVGNVVATDATLLRKAAFLLPPSSFAVQLIQAESPLLLTTSAEQAMLAAITNDKTLVRVTFDYHHVHDVNYAFADRVELFFRTEMPRNVAGALLSVSDDPNDSRKAVVRTTKYDVLSQGTVIVPSLAASLHSNFIGGVLSCQQENYVITNVAASTAAGEGPSFTIRKNVKENPTDVGATGGYVTVQDYIAPRLVANAQVLFMAVENMAEAASWGNPNPLTKTIALLPGFSTHTESYTQDGTTKTLTLRGLAEKANVTHLGDGLYRIAFTSPLPHHPQHSDADPVDWYKGVVRVPRAADPQGPRKVIDVMLLEHVGDGQSLVLHALDDQPADAIQTGAAVDVNYYPGYRLYLHADQPNHFNAATIQPAAGEGTRKTWLAARSADTIEQCASPVGIPAPIVAVEVVRPLTPGQPCGPEYATWPDFYYKSSYTCTIAFSHKPFAVAIYRSNDEAILRALYKETTYAAVRQELDTLGDDDPHRADRWQDLLGLDYPNGTLTRFPAETGYAFPNPDKGGDLDGSAPATIVAALRDAIWGAFTALTEQPLIHDLIKSPPYVPTPKRPTLRDAQGRLLSPSDPAFDASPMATKTGRGYEIQFTDFTLDGTGNNVFFYLAREIGNRGRLGDAGPIAGPVLLINTRPPEPPAIRRVSFRDSGPLAMPPAVVFDVNAYPPVQKVGRMLVYQTTDAAAALSVRTMELVKTIDLKLAPGGSVTVVDDFEDGVIPYGEKLFYRLVAMRSVRTPDRSEWVPSAPSKLLLTTVVDSRNPDAPELGFSSDGVSGIPPSWTNVALQWLPTVNDGTYYLDTMTSLGTWRNIYEINTNLPVSVNLAATDLGTNALLKEDDEGKTLYTRFRVRVVNRFGLFNLGDRVLTI